jgi:gamma-glutamyl-gamma-aminobutyrate hydrolase PuuD|nr:MAG TPA: putative glutamine amidotransferase [Caudoviricetes sp.]
MKVFVVGGSVGYANFLENASLVNDIKEADVVLFTGGEDVDPSLYKCEKHPRTYSNLQRDLEEKKVFESVIPNKQVCLGICRGSQFLCVMNGGLLVQHCDNHAIGYTHGITDGKVCYQITSTHHQMQYPYNLNRKDYNILFRSEECRSTTYGGENIDSDYIRSYGEPEIVYYHKDGLPKCLAVQGHPEMIPNSPVAKMINNLVKKLVDEIR